MNNPYQSPESDSTDSAPEAGKQEYVKLLCLTLRLRHYLMLQALIILTSLVIGIVFTFVLDGQYFGEPASRIGLYAFLVIFLELGELIYALKRKRFTR